MKVWEKILWTLFSINQPIPIDKLCVFLITSLYYKKCDIYKRSKILILYFIFFLTILTSFIINNNGNILIFFPLFFTFCAVIASHAKISYKLIQNSLLLNIYSGIILAIISTIINKELAGTLSLIEKGLPFIYAPVGYCPTLQVYGSLCVTWILLAFEFNQKKSYNFYIIFFCALITLNRATIIFLVIILFTYKTKKTFLTCLVILCILLSQDYITEMFLSSSTLNSREELRVGAEISYWNSKDIITYLIGKGSHLTTEAIANKTLWGRQYIENGLDFILHSYGIIGFIIYNVLIIYLIIKSILNKKIKVIPIIIYYYFVEQFLTNEYLTPSFTYVSLSILIIINNIENEKNSNNTSII